MHPKKKSRIISIILLLCFTTSGVMIILYNLDDSIVFFYPPSDIDKIKSSKSKIRVGGLVKSNSIEDLPNNATRFTITDHNKDLIIEYTGPLPAMFRAGQGIVAEGKFDNLSMKFQAKSLLTKHDENYMPPEVAKNLQKDANS